MQVIFATDCSFNLRHPIWMEQSDELKAFSERLNQVCDEMQLPFKQKGRQVELGRIFGVGQRGARKWLEAESFPSTDKIIKMAVWGNVSMDWLLTGRGQKRIVGELGINDAAPVYLGPRDRALLENVKQCTEDDRRSMERWALLCATAQPESDQLKAANGEG
jgi:transcriptional regulator with XRE-family HTH domain